MEVATGEQREATAVDKEATGGEVVTGKPKGKWDQRRSNGNVK